MMSNSKQRKITVITGSRADFGLLVPVMKAIENHPKLQLQVVVTGMHWIQGTWKDIRDSGFEGFEKVIMQQLGLTGRFGDVTALGHGVTRLAKTFECLKPDVVLVLGDRIEAMAGALAASVGGIYVAHVHGGDRAEGVADEAMRHAISKLSHLHFAATRQSQKRLLRMGETPESVFQVGSPAVDGLDQIKASLGNLGPDLIVLQHPVGGSDVQEKKWMAGTLNATEKYLLDQGNLKRWVLAPNGDPGCRGILSVLREKKCKTKTHLSRKKFIAILKNAKLIVGNSSAGLIEAAILGVPCVNVGPRQNGREKPKNVVDCDYGKNNVLSGIKKALKLNLSSMKHPYGDGKTGLHIAKNLARFNLTKLSIHKHNTY